jgi:hypothetical protein
LTPKARFIPWYKVAKAALGDLIKSLTDVEVMEYVSDDKLLTTPMSYGDREKRPLPLIEVEEISEQLGVSVAYRDAESVRHLKNMLHSSQMQAQASFNASMKILPISFETKLSKRGFKETSYVLQKKYIASRVDAAMLSRIIEESEIIRSGGRRTSSGRSIYEAPATPVLQLLYIQIKPDEGELTRILFEMKPVITILIDIKTQNELIHSRIAKSVDKAATYRGFIDLLNRARNTGLVSAEERRALDKKWRENPNERGPIEEDLRRGLGETN